MIKFFLDQGAKINAQNEYGNTPLMQAVKNGQEIAVIILLARGADPTIRNNYGQNAMHIAAELGHANIVTVLLHRSPINAPDYMGQIPLHYASAHGHLFILELLLKNGADIALCDLEGMSPLHHAASFGHADAVKMLMTYGARDSIISPRSLFYASLTAAGLAQKKYLETQDATLKSQYERIMLLLAQKK